jgi:hypothetical protein
LQEKTDPDFCPPKDLLVLKELMQEQSMNYSFKDK